MTEKSFEAQLMCNMRYHGFFVEKMSLINKPGIPDLLCAYEGIAFFMELKVLNNNVLTLKQLFRPAQISYALANLDKIIILFLIKHKNRFLLFKPDEYFLKNITDLKLGQIEHCSDYYRQYNKLSEIIEDLKETK